MVKPFIKKQDPNLPDGYTMAVHYVNGEKEELEVSLHKIIDYVVMTLPDRSKRLEASACPFIEYCTKDDRWGQIPLSSVQRMEFDKRFSKIVALREEAQLKGQNR